jgi:peptidyl-prolyl cis-trans isomerase SurA
MARKFSDDRATAAKNGFLGFITIGQYDDTFESEAFSLKNDGDYTAPFKTALGYHIKRIFEKKTCLTTTWSKNHL